MSGAENINIAAKVATFHVVIARATVHGVVSGLAFQGVIARTAVEVVIAVPAAQVIIACPAVEGVVAILTEEAVIARPAVQGVITVTTGDAVIAFQPVNGVIADPAVNVITAGRATELKCLFGNVCHAQRLPVKLEVEAAVVVAVEIVGQGNPVIAAAVGIDNKVATFAAEAGIGGFRAFKAQGVGVLVFVSLLGNGVLAVSGAENINIAAKVATFHIVIAFTTIKDIFALIPIEAVIALVANQVIRAVIAAQGIVVVRAEAVSQGGE